MTHFIQKHLLAGGCRQQCGELESRVISSGMLGSVSSLPLAVGEALLCSIRWCLLVNSPQVPAIAFCYFAGKYRLLDSVLPAHTCGSGHFLVLL